MKRRLFLALLSAAAVLAASAGGFAAPLPNEALFLSFPKMSAVTKVQYGCGWTYSCSSGGSTQVQVYGPVNVYSNGGTVEVKPPDDTWKEPSNELPWGWRGIGCGGYPCDDRCGAFCWWRRIRNGYCGHGCDVYREHVGFVNAGGYPRPFVYRNPGDGYDGYGAVSYGNGGGSGYYGQSGTDPGYYGQQSGSADYGQSTSTSGDYDQGQQSQAGYDSSGSGSGGAPSDYARNAPPQQDRYAPEQPRERFIDRLRRYFYGSPRREEYRDTAAVRGNGGVRFERPMRDESVPMRRFRGPKYPPDGTSAQTK